MENVKNYTLEEFIGLYDRYLALRRAANDNNYELEFRQSVEQFREVIIDYANNLVRQHPDDKKIAAVLLNSGVYPITSSVYVLFDESLRNDKYLTLLALKGGLSKEDYSYIGNKLRNDKEVMYLAARGDMSGNRINTFHQFGNDLLSDQEFLTNIFRVWGNSVDLEQLKYTCEHYGVPVQQSILIDSYHRASALNSSEGHGLFRYTSPYDSGLINYSPHIYYNSKQIAELSDMFDEKTSNSDLLKNNTALK